MVTLIGNLLGDPKDKSRQIDSFSEMVVEEPGSRRPEASHQFFRSVNQLSPISGKQQPIIKRVNKPPPFMSPVAAKSFNPANFSSQLRLKLGTPQVSRQQYSSTTKVTSESRKSMGKEPVVIKVSHSKRNLLFLGDTDGSKHFSKVLMSTKVLPPSGKPRRIKH